MELNFRSRCASTMCLMKCKVSSKGPGPDDLPPKVLSLAPCGLSFDKSHSTSYPSHIAVQIASVPIAQPSLESSNTILLFSPFNFFTLGIFSMYLLETSTPTPAPLINKK